jgi:hypothetical protein
MQINVFMIYLDRLDTRGKVHTLNIYPTTVCCSSSTRPTDQTLFASSICNPMIEVLLHLTDKY